ncbi:Rps23 Pro-64 3,4-dihydroxylase Tpa1-like proline 4-hydroxylase [Luteimonas cucumeris]|uniref:Rps23 Pro-64 3,4-dihydroxylase Tpa1-like proline 4-hydroxylase n=1 Tax=Luteimonas cucumeris TaxID=985012 RepID=A0A562KY73_9GAMM|nr:2OG-Fe(II) oxygenase [Luteimonas cucumeris]TWI00335.1 Rps23 Pro-64 3,4-dihydroxylase Tpa1-like proline 4-hydroxylase [Luteimonas cucumeris]
MIVSPQVLSDVDNLRARFCGAQPFRHIVIDDFLDAGFADALLAQFPDFERGNSNNEYRQKGGKSVVESVRKLGPAYQQMDDVIQGREFLGLIERITGIPELLYDPYYLGGGTHSNRSGQSLDAHVDFNYHPVDEWHRRLNLIVYLNPEWQDSWGGQLQLHSDPRRDDNRTSSIAPVFNRAVIFETNEVSWHGFPEIRMPEDRQSLTRKSVALYFYTRDRPEEETVGKHTTVYIDRPLPEHLRAGHVLDDGDMQELQALLSRRDHHIQRLYRELHELTAARDRGALGRILYLAKRAYFRARR